MDGYMHKRIVVCDSGLGGLDIASHFFASDSGPECDVIYVNAYPDRSWGYNDLPTEREQEELFRSVLESMEQWRPELCLVACNTLSIIWGRLSKRWKPSFPVIGIIDVAISLMYNYLERYKEADVLILGTKSTVASNVYQSALEAKGIYSARIHSMPCHRLATLIEQDPAAEDVRARISEYANQARSMFETLPRRLALAFCCTHYGYASGFWKEEFSKFFPCIDLLNPNDSMACDGRGVSFRYHSHIELEEGQRRAMAAVFSTKAPMIAEALLHAAAT